MSNTNFFKFISEIGSTTRTPRKKKAKESPAHINRPVSWLESLFYRLFSFARFFAYVQHIFELRRLKMANTNSNRLIQMYCMIFIGNFTKFTISNKTTHITKSTNSKYVYIECTTRFRNGKCHFLIVVKFMLDTQNWP